RGENPPFFACRATPPPAERLHGGVSTCSGSPWQSVTGTPDANVESVGLAPGALALVRSILFGSGGVLGAILGGNRVVAAGSAGKARGNAGGCASVGSKATACRRALRASCVRPCWASNTPTFEHASAGRSTRAKAR